MVARSHSRAPRRGINWMQLLIWIAVAIVATAALATIMIFFWDMQPNTTPPVWVEVVWVPSALTTVLGACGIVACAVTN